MRKADINGVHDSFNEQMAATMKFYSTVKGFLKRSEAYITDLSSLTMISAVTLWESFLSDLIIAYINIDPRTFSTHMENALKENLSGKQKQILNRYAPYKSPNNINRKTIISLIDNDGKNITFTNSRSLKRAARRWISPDNMAGINELSDIDIAIIDLWIALRNHIAHDSEYSNNVLKKAVSDENLFDTGLYRAQNSIRKPGAYLKAKHPQPNGTPRIEIILGHMQRIADAI